MDRFCYRGLALAQLLGERLRRMSKADGGLDHLTQPLHGRKVAFPESMRSSGKQFEYTQDMVIVHHGHDQNRGDSHLAADLAVHARIAFGVVAAQKLARAHALAREAE